MVQNYLIKKTLDHIISTILYKKKLIVKFQTYFYINTSSGQISHSKEIQPKTSTNIEKCFA